MHIGLHRLQFDLQPKGIPEGAVGVGEPEIKFAVGIVVASAHGEHATVPGKHIHLDD